MSVITQITLSFWIMKICATTLGETAGDLMSMTLNIGYAKSSLILIGLFFTALLLQLLSKKFRPALYWTVILATSTAGTTMSDYIDRTLKWGYPKGTFFLSLCLVTILAVWRWSEKSLSVSRVTSTKAEIFYWTAILFSNTLGTALGDFLSDSSGLGFKGGAFLIGGLLVFLVAAYYFIQINRVFLFWVAFVLTRPFGATFGDLLTKPTEKGGLNLGTMGSSAVLAIILIGSVIYTSRKSKQPTPSGIRG